MAKRTASTFKPDTDLEGVAPEDVRDNAIENRLIANNELDAPKLEQAADGAAGIPVEIVNDVTTGASSIKIYDADAPFKFEVIDVTIQPRGASTNGTIKITNGTNDITDAIVCAVDKTMIKATTIDNAYSTIAAAGTLEIVCAGDSVAATIALVTIKILKRD